MVSGVPLPGHEKQEDHPHFARLLQDRRQARMTDTTDAESKTIAEQTPSSGDEQQHHHYLTARQRLWEDIHLTQEDHEQQHHHHCPIIARQLQDGAPLQGNEQHHDCPISTRQLGAFTYSQQGSDKQYHC